MAQTSTDWSVYIWFLLEKAILEYEQEGDNVLNLWHTEVPVSHRRQGLGAQLAKVYEGVG